MSRREEFQISALQATTASLGAQIAALNVSGGTINVTRLLSNAQASTGNFYGPADVPSWSGTFSAVGGHQLFVATLTALTGEFSPGPRTYSLKIDGAVVASRTIFHAIQAEHYSVSLFGLSLVSAGSHTFAISIPADTVANDGDFADVLIVEF